MSQNLKQSSRVPVGFWTGAIFSAVAALIIGCGGSSGDTSTTGTPTTGLTTSTASTNATTATTATTTTTTASTTTSSTAGTLPQNVIIYSDAPDATSANPTVNYNYVTPTGTGGTLLASLPGNFGGIAFNSANQLKYFSYTANTTTPSYGIYSNTTYSISGATQIVAPSAANPYVFAGELQVSPDGTTLYYLAAIGQNEAQIYSVPVAGGVAPTALDFALDTFQLNQAGNQLVYGKVAGDNQIEIFTRAIAPTSTPVQLTNSKGAYSSDEPQWNKAGTQIAFTADPPNASGPDFVFTMNANGTSLTQVTNTATQDDHTPSFNGAGTALSFVSLSGGALADQGLYTVTLGGAADLNRTEIVADPSILTGTYWTTSTGRGAAKGWGFLNHWRSAHKFKFAKRAPASSLAPGRVQTP